LRVRLCEMPCRQCRRPLTGTKQKAEAAPTTTFHLLLLCSISGAVASTTLPLSGVNGRRPVGLRPSGNHDLGGRGRSQIPIMSGAPQSRGLSCTPRALDNLKLQDQQVRHSNATRERCLIVATLICFPARGHFIELIPSLARRTLRQLVLVLRECWFPLLLSGDQTSQASG
jgi:hypothetical protein